MKNRIVSLALVIVFVMFPMAVFGKGGSGGGGSGGCSFSSGSRSSSSPKTFSTPKASPTPKAPVAPSTNKSDSRTKFDSKAALAQKQQESKKAFDAARASSKERSVTDLRRELSQAKMENRSLRQQQVFGTYYNRPAPCCYNDGFNIWFWLWLLDRPRGERDDWIYHHRDELDTKRLEELKQRDPDFEKRLQGLEAKGITKDPSYAPKGIDRDLMYGDAYVQKIYEENMASTIFWTFFWSIVGLISLIAAIFLVRWHVKRRRYV